MYNLDTELMFPLRVVPQLRAVRGEDWHKLIDQITLGNASIEDQAGFTLLMVRLGGCQSCTIDSFRGMRGCTQCARQTLKRYRGSDQDLLHQYQQAKTEVETYLAKSNKK